MSTDDTHNEGDNPNPEQGKSFPGRFVLEYDKQPINDLVNAIKERARKENEEKQHSESAAQRQANEQARANRISIASIRMYKKSNLANWVTVTVNGLIFLATFGVFCYNIRSTNAAKTAADAAIKADSISYLNYKLAQEEFDSSKNASKKAADLSRQSMQTQIDQFVVENRPYLFMSYEDNVINGFYNIDIRITNTGKTPAIIEKINKKVEITSDSVINKFHYDRSESFNFRMPVASNHYEQINAFNRKKKADSNEFIYTHGEVYYLDIVRHTHCLYKFCLKRRLSDQFTDMPKNHNGTIELGKTSAAPNW